MSGFYGVVIRPLLVATIQRLPQRTIESTRPSCGTVLPAAALKIPFGPSKTAVPLTTSRTVQPSMVVGRVSGTGTSFGGLSGSPARRSIEANCGCTAGERLLGGIGLAEAAPTDRLRLLSAPEAESFVAGSNLAAAAPRLVAAPAWMRSPLVGSGTEAEGFAAGAGNWDEPEIGPGTLPLSGKLDGVTMPPMTIHAEPNAATRTLAPSAARIAKPSRCAAEIDARSVISILISSGSTAGRAIARTRAIDGSRSRSSASVAAMVPTTAAISFSKSKGDCPASSIGSSGDMIQIPHPTHSNHQIRK